jgi:mRNA-degrading endonuclease HigB of HigAB toxin-antitoxin module
VVWFVVFYYTGPNNVKQYFEAFTNNGQLNSMYVLFNTPGGGNTIRIFNHNTVEFPIKAYVTAVKP